MTLQEVGRIAIRRILRANISSEHPDINNRKRAKKLKPKAPRRHRRINVVPMSMGMMIMGNFDDSEVDSDTSLTGRSSHDTSGDEEHKATQHSEDEEGSGQEEEEEEEDNSFRGEDDEGPRGMPAILRQMAAMQRRLMDIARREHRERHRQGMEYEPECEQAQGDDTDQGLGEEINNAEPHHSVQENGMVRLADIVEHGEGERSEGKETSPAKCSDASPSSSDDMDMELPEASSVHSEAIPITTGAAGRQRCSSNTSMSTSCTSGIGTCSSVDEHSDLDFLKELDSEANVLSTSANSGFSASHIRKPEGESNGSRVSKDTDMLDIDSFLAETAAEENGRLQSRQVGNANGRAPHSPTCTEGGLCGLRHLVRPGGRSESSMLDAIAEADANSLEAQDALDMDCFVQDPDDENMPSFRRCMREKVEQLPVPTAVKHFLLFYRN